MTQPERDEIDKIVSQGWDRAVKALATPRTHKGQQCPYDRKLTCQEAYCHRCQIWLNWLRGQLRSYAI